MSKPNRSVDGEPTTSLFLQRYLQAARERVLANLDGLSEYEIRRPMTQTGTNLLGLVKHLAGIELGYLGACVGRPAPMPMPWTEEEIRYGGDMWAKQTESRGDVVGFYRAAWAHGDASIAEFDLDTPASVSWWAEDERDTTFGHLLVRVVDETAHHAGHSDLVRELLRPDERSDELAPEQWDAFVRDIDRAAGAFG